MGFKSRKPCRTPNCAGLAEKDFCDTCKSKGARVTENRPNSYQRGYNRKWIKCRKSYKAKKPICEQCLKEGIINDRNLEVDHIVSMKDGGAQYDHANNQTLCRRHHAIKTARETRERNKTANRMEM